MATTAQRLRGVNARIINFLKEGHDFTTDEAKQIFGIANVSARVSEIRQNGYKVTCTPKSFGYLYELASPRRVAASKRLKSNRKK